MRKSSILVVGTSCLVLFTGLGNKEPQSNGVTANVPRPAALKVETDYGKMPLYFIPNRGQVDKQVAYYVRGKDKTLYFTSQGITFSLLKTTHNDDHSTASRSAGLESRTGINDVSGPRLSEAKKESHSERWVVKLDFVGANPDVQPVGEDETGAAVSYFKGKPEDWKTGLPTYSRVIYPNLWPGIDLVYHGTVNRLKYEFIVRPGADPSKIRLAYRGAQSVSVDGEGCLKVTTPVGGFTDDVPVAYQEKDGRRVDIKLAYKMDGRSIPIDEVEIADQANRNHEGKSEYGFKVGDFDPSLPLVLDPAILVYCGYIGGSSVEAMDHGFGIAVDGSGNAYVTGTTYSTEATFPVAAGPDLIQNGGADAFVTKVNSAGTALVYCGYIGGYDDDSGLGIAVDASGNAYVAGITYSTEATFPVTGGPDLTFNDTQSGYDAFVAQVNASGTALLYCGYIGGSYNDSGQGIAVDASGNAYVTGYTGSTQATFPVTVGPDLTFNGGTTYPYGDAFVAKVNATGTALVYCGYIGGSAGENGPPRAGRAGIAVDGSGNAYVTGTTYSTEATFPVKAGPDLTFNGGFTDAFVAEVNAAGTALVYCGYIGGSSDDWAYGIAVDESGNAYVTGETASTEASFPVTGGPDLTFNDTQSASDAFVAKVNASGAALSYCGYIGGSTSDAGLGIALDWLGNAYVTGYTWSTEATFPVTVGPDLTQNGTGDAFVTMVNAAGTALSFCGYIGGSDDDSGQGIAVDGLGNAYVTGYTGSNEATFPVTVGPDLTYNGRGDGFVAMIKPTIIHVSRRRLNSGSLWMTVTTKSQSVLISFSGGETLNWTATSDQSWITLLPASGTGTALIEVGVDPSGLGVGTYAGTIFIEAPGAANSPVRINVTLKVFGSGSTTAPFGYFDTPVDGTTGVEGSLPVTGWALDDIEATKVDIWRDPVGAEPVHPNGYVYIGDAVFVEGARPDVETAFPAYPLNYLAGWGYMMLTNFLPNQGNGTFRIHAIAYDKDGHSTLIGTKTITCDNAHATLPFGAIDTPTQGGTWNGTQVNFGWALTPQPKSIPTDGSTIWLWIDGLPIGHPTYNNYREDIATLFPGFANSNGAVGYYYVDTTQYESGVHTIAWSVEDSAGEASGIGSRYFMVVNTGTGSITASGQPFSRSVSGESGQGGMALRGARSIPTDYVNPVYVKRGYDPESLAETIFPDANGVITVEANEVDRIEIGLSEIAANESPLDGVGGQEKGARTDDQEYVGYLVVGNRLRSLPIGSSFDPRRGVFSWQLGPGFVGEYNFVFMRQGGTSIKNKKNILVRILPAFQLKK